MIITWKEGLEIYQRKAAREGVVIVRSGIGGKTAQLNALVKELRRVGRIVVECTPTGEDRASVYLPPQRRIDLVLPFFAGLEEDKEQAEFAVKYGLNFNPARFQNPDPLNNPHGNRRYMPFAIEAEDQHAKDALEFSRKYGLNFNPKRFLK